MKHDSIGLKQINPKTVKNINDILFFRLNTKPFVPWTPSIVNYRMEQKRMKHTLILFFAFYLFAFNQTSFSAPSTKDKNNIKELIRLDSIANSIKMSTSHSNKIWVDMLLKEAITQRNEHYKADAYYLLAKYYYSINPDSMRMYLRIGEPLFIRQKRWEDLFRIRGWNIVSMINEGKEDQILPAVQQMINDSHKYNFPDGEEIANQALALFYFNKNLPNEGEQLLNEVLAQMESRHVPLFRKFNVLRLLLERDDLNNAALHQRYLNMLSEYIAYCEKNNIEELSSDITLDFMKFVYYRVLITDATKKKDTKTASLYLQKIKTLKHSYETDTALFTAWMGYYKESKQYEEGLKLSTRALALPFVKQKIRVYLDMMRYQADFNKLLGNYAEADKIYSSYIQKNDSVMSAKYYNDLAELSTQREMDKLALKNKQMELQSTKDHARMLLMEGGILLMLIICIASGYIAYTRYKYGIRLKKAKEKAEEAEHLKSTFLANMNHEIRTPLNAIVGFSQVLVDEENIECRRQYANIIDNNNELLQRLISDVLDLSKIESNALQLNYTETSLATLMDRIYSSTLLRMPKGVRLELTPEKELMFDTDKNRLTQIITNLLNNAIKHTKEGFIRFGYEIKEDEKFVRFFVEDTGEGIPEDKLNDIFTRFVQLKEMDRGVGLGLAICKGLVSQMGGTIGVSSILGKGSTFTVLLPLRAIFEKNNISTKKD